MLEARTRSLESELEDLRASGFTASLTSQVGQRYVIVGNVPIPNPPWSQRVAAIAIALPGLYPTSGLDAFYVADGIDQGGTVPYKGASATLDGRLFHLISWHYATGRIWDPATDDIASHVAHCRNFFLARGIR